MLAPHNGRLLFAPPNEASPHRALARSLETAHGPRRSNKNARSAWWARYERVGEAVALHDGHGGNASGSGEGSQEANARPRSVYAAREHFSVVSASPDCDRAGSADAQRTQTPAL